MERKYTKLKLAKPRKGSGVIVRPDSEYYHCDINIKGIPRVRKCLETSDLEFAERQVANIRNQVLEGKYFNKRPSVNLEKVFNSYWKTNGSQIVNKDNVIRSMVYLGEFLEKILGSAVSLEMVEDFHIRQYIEYRRTCKVVAHNAKNKKPKENARCVSDSSIKKEIYVFSAINRYAKDVLGVQSSSADIKQVVKVLKPCRSLEASISPEKQIIYFNTLPDYLKLPVLLQRLMGLRWGNVKNLRKEDICWDSMTISFSVKTSRKDRNQKVIRLPISDEVLNVLLAAGVKRGCDSKGEVFTYINRSQKRVPLGDHKKAFIASMEKAGIKKQRGQLTHLIRHTAATDALRTTGNLIAAKNLLGHSDVKTTQKYVHLVESEIKDAMSKSASHVTEMTRNLIDRENKKD
jgi:integrase